MNYLVNNRKKIERLQRLETDLRRLLAHQASPEKLIVAATEVRDARVRVLRLKQSLICPRGEKALAHYEKLQLAIEIAQRCSPEAVLAEFLSSKVDASQETPEG